MVGRLIVWGIDFPKKLLLICNGLLIPFGSWIWPGSFTSISSPFKREQILGKGAIGESGNVTFNALDVVAIIEDMSLVVGTDAVVADTGVADAGMVVFNVGNSNIGGHVKSEDVDNSSISLSFSIAFASSISLHGACISYGFSSPRISPNYWEKRIR